MKKSILALGFMGLLTACGSQTLDIHPQPLNNPTLQSQSVSQTPRLFETFNGYLSHSPYDSTKVAEMLMKVKSLMGSTYDNKNSATRYRLFYNNQKDDLSLISGPVRLSKDGVMYLEHKNLIQGQIVLQYYRLGTYAPLAEQAADGQEIKFQLDQGHSLKMKWRGINPMNHDTIHFYINPQVKPISVPPTALR